MYSEKDLLVMGKRYGNKKRKYLLIDPLQAKHLAVPPSEALKMMRELGEKLSRQHPDTACIIGFAETATAISAAAAECFQGDTLYLQTTREDLPKDENLLEFSEEHSHAVEQILDIHKLSERAERGELKPGKILLIDDEISTGKTCANIISRLKESVPQLAEREFVVGSVLNRLTAEMSEDFSARGISFSALLNIENRDFETQVSGIEICAPSKPGNDIIDRNYNIIFSTVKLCDPRRGLSVDELKKNADDFAAKVYGYLSGLSGKVLVLGTEECMLPAIKLGALIEKNGANVFTHSTTRSPIGVCPSGDYPIKEGFRIASFYDDKRETYIYNPDVYDTVIVVTDSKNDIQTDTAMRDIMRVFSQRAKDFLLVRG